VAAAAAGLAWLAAGLTARGAGAATVVGTLVLGGTGWMGGAVLAAFFVSSTLVSRLARPAAAGLDPKGERRDAWQVAANGGAAAVLALLGRQHPALALWLVTGTLAAAAADTWATSIGSWSEATPRRILGWRPVPRGSSGGITLLGCLGGAAGAALVAVAGVAAGGPATLFPVGTLVGFLGMIADSLLGAGAQARFRCPTCRLASEWPVHRCGTPTVHEAGIRWLNNDVVNVLGTVAAGALAFLFWVCC
jgi:uncharacterized protein (TIGR00297 family)